VVPLLRRVADGQVRRAVIGRPAVVPLEHAPRIRVLGGLAVERTGEAEEDAVLLRVERRGLVKRLAGVANALEHAIPHAGGLPAAEAADVELAVLRAEAAAHDAAGEAEREPPDGPLRDAVHLLG